MHSSQLVCPVLVWYLPATQFAQVSAEPVPSANVPGAQFVQAVACSAEYFPAAQTTQEEATAYSPAGQEKEPYQLRPVDAHEVPLGQALHELLPTVSW